jgi:hypothetical protein
VWISVSTPLSLAQAHEVAAFLGGLPSGVVPVVGGRHHEAVAAANARIRAATSMAALTSIAHELS